MAKPTEGGFARKTEYTFFRKVSPTIQPGPLLLDWVNSKIDPTHWPLEICVNLKSAGEIDHDWPPKENATLTGVEQAVERYIFLSTHQYFSMARQLGTHGRCNSPGNYQYLGQTRESAHRRKRLERQVRQ